MNRYLFFRTDKIGDFLMSSILLKSIKRNDPNSHITVVASNKNFFFIKKLNLVDKVIEYPSSPFKRFFFFLNLLKKKYYLSVVLDGKKRSIFNSILSRSNTRILLTTKKIYKKIFNFFFISIIHNESYDSKIEEIKKILEILSFNFNESDLNILNNEDKLLNKYNNLPAAYGLFHFDEKWIKGKYRDNYTNIEPSIEELVSFLKRLVDKTNLDLIVSTGAFSNEIVNQLKKEFLSYENNDFRLNYNNKTIILLTCLPFLSLGYVISKSNLIIGCHGATSHLASAFHIKIIDIYEQSEKSSYYKWNSHFRKYNVLFRDSFKFLSKKIIDKL